MPVGMIRPSVRTEGLSSDWTLYKNNAPRIATCMVKRDDGKDHEEIVRIDYSASLFHAYHDYLSATT